MWPFKKVKKPDPDNYRLVKTVDTTVSWKGKDKREDTICYYLYENPYGDRKIEYKHTDTHNIFPKGSNTPLEMCFYLEKVYPWTQGSPTIDTPSYWDVARTENKQCVDELYRRLLINAKAPQ